ncbi:hypothetical protein CEXT_75971 [Caerostris extrusa]|uniref:Uncharacterized protein n=1 Tax=Caerostris extrusa TaxID=172846 RepID=A0AAV4W1E8_CAEEX|nr:hypothetical protein CEXT_75971 [Caerostris extrusa]
MTFGRDLPFYRFHSFINRLSKEQRNGYALSDSIIRYLKVTAQDSDFNWLAFKNNSPSNFPPHYENTSNCHKIFFVSPRDTTTPSTCRPSLSSTFPAFEAKTFAHVACSMPFMEAFCT